MKYHLGSGTGRWESSKGNAAQLELSQLRMFGEFMLTEEQQSTHLRVKPSLTMLCLVELRKSSSEGREEERVGYFLSNLDFSVQEIKTLTSLF